MVVWLKKVRLVAKLQQVDDVASLLPFYFEGDALGMEEDDQKRIEQIQAQLKEVFNDDAFAAYRKVTMIMLAGERVDVYANKIKQLVRWAGEAHKTVFRYGAPLHCVNWTSTGTKHRSPVHG